MAAVRSFFYYFFAQVAFIVATSQGGQRAEEDLSVVHLPDARTVAHFEFTTTWDLHPLALVKKFQGIIGCSHLSPSLVVTVMHCGS